MAAWTPIAPDYFRPALPHAVWDYYTGRWVSPEQESIQSRQHRVSLNGVFERVGRALDQARSWLTRPRTDAGTQTDTPSPQTQVQTESRQSILETLARTTNDVARIAQAMRPNGDTRPPLVAETTRKVPWWEQPGVIVAGLAAVLLLVLLKK